MPRPVLVVGGAPRLAIDAIRFLSVKATGETANQVACGLAAAGVPATLLLGMLATLHHHGLAVARFDSRADLERELQRWIQVNPEGVVVMSAAVNDYEVHRVESSRGAEVVQHKPGTKIPSGAEELVIRLRRSGKVVDRLRDWGLRGPIVAFKYEAAETVVSSAQALQRRLDAALVVANSICGRLQALVDATRVETAPSREALVERLVARLAALAQTP